MLAQHLSDLDARLLGPVHVLEQVPLQRLNADGQAGGAMTSQDGNTTLSAQSLWRALEVELEALDKAEMGMNGLQQLVELLGRQQAGGAATKIQGAELMPLVCGAS